MATPTARDVGQTVKFKTGNELVQGVLRYLGRVDGQQGDWCGVELQEPKGKNNGTVKDKAYFRCPPKHGIFVKKDVVSVVTTTRSPAKRLSTVPPTAATPKPTATALKRTSIGPTARPSTARQSISSVPARRTPGSRPTSQTIFREPTQPKAANRVSIQDEPSKNSTQNEESADISEDDEEEQEEDDVEEKDEDQRFRAPSQTQQTPSRPESRTVGRALNPDALLVSELSRENGTLKVKLQTMEKKRMEDREVIKRVDTLLSENEHLSNIIKTLQVKVRTTTEERRDAQAKVQALEQQLQAEPERPAEFESELELATLNKEMAEEKAEGLQLSTLR